MGVTVFTPPADSPQLEEKASVTEESFQNIVTNVLNAYPNSNFYGTFSSYFYLYKKLLLNLAAYENKHVCILL